MKKTFDYLFYSGLTIIFMPLGLATLIFTISANTSNNSINSPKEIIERHIIYDTVKVKVEVPQIITSTPKKEKKKPKEDQDSIPSTKDTL